MKQEVDDDLSIRVDERSLCGLSITGGIKIDQCHGIKGNDVTFPSVDVPTRKLDKSLGLGDWAWKDLKLAYF